MSDPGRTRAEPPAYAPFQCARWLVEAKLPALVEQNVERICRSEDVRHVALMPDLHLGRLANNGMVVATSFLVYPQAYFRDMQWAIHYATMNRLAILARVAEIFEERFGIRADQESYIDSPHNFARQEEHFGQQLIVHRKSAASAKEGEMGLVAGSMGTPSFIVSGRGHPDSLGSCAHGAGRLLGRREAQRRIRPRDMQRQLGRVHYDRQALDSLRDEAPAAYRDIRAVMRAQHALTRQVACLHPVLSFKYPDPRG